MKVTIDSGIWNSRSWEELYINGISKLHVHDLCECPEDATIARDLVTCYDVYSLMKLAYEAGKASEELTLEEIKGEVNE